MLQNIRKSTKGTPAKIVVGLIVISFAFFGIQSILLDGGGNEIAVVNGEDIYPGELDQAVQAQKRRLIGMLGDNVDPAILDDERLRPQAMESLINRKLLVQSAAAMKLFVSEAEIGAVVASMEQFQVDGVFSPDLYKRAISGAGFSPGTFKILLHNDLLVNQASSGLAASEFVTSSELNINARIMAEQRDFRYFTLSLDNFNANSITSDEEIEAYYNAHPVGFRTPESVDLEYLELALDDFRQPAEERAILEAYEVASQDHQYQTQNRVSHILFEAGGETDMQQRITEAQAQLAAGVSFSDVAKEFSDDVGSAQKGGDLGYSSGDAFPESMEEAIASLEPGTVSIPVETPAGTHLIQVTERKLSEMPSLDEMRDQLEGTIQADEARAELISAAEILRDLTFNAEDLSDPATELGLVVEQEKGVARNQNEGLFSSPALLEAAFSEDVLLSGHNSKVIELTGEQFVVLRVRKHNAPELMPLESVREKIVAVVSEEAARAAVNKAASQALEQLRSGLSMEQIADTQGVDLQVELGVNRRGSAAPPDVLSRIFALPPPVDDAVSADYITAPNGDAFVMELQRVLPGEYASMEAAERTELMNMISVESGSLVYQDYQRGLREQADITVQ